MEGGGTLLLESSWAQWIPYDQCYVSLYGAEGGASIEWGGNHQEPYQRINVWTEVEGMPAELQPVVGPDCRPAAAVESCVVKVRSGEHAAHSGASALRRVQAHDACCASRCGGAG